MTAYVVDTNVAIAANGRNTHANDKCRKTCIQKLKDICSQHVVVLDDGGCIFGEYKRKLNFAGAPGVGDMFFKHIFNHGYDERHVRRVSITPCDDDCRDFEELPKNKLDRSDRKFLATAVVAKATIINAMDGDWDENQALIKSLRVTVQELCPHMLETR